MDVRIKRIQNEETEYVGIYCHEVTNEVRDIAEFVRSRQGSVIGMRDGKTYELNISDICYLESVDNRTYLYTKSSVFEARQKLYEFEELLRDSRYLRVSKSVLLNLMAVVSIKPALNGRFTADLKNGEQIIISRRYVPALKETLRGGR